MVKTLRKYQKWILVIGGTLLMVTFLVQGTFSAFTNNPARRAVGTLRGHTLTVGDLASSETEYAFLENTAPAVMKLGLGVENPYHWFLLTQEAEQAGLTGDAGDGAGSVEELIQSETVSQLRAKFGNNPQILNLVLRNEQFLKPELDKVRAQIELRRAAPPGSLHMTSDQADRALGKLRGVSRLVNSQIQATRFSDRRAAVNARKTFDNAVVDMVIVPAKASISTVPDPTGEELEAHFRAYRDKDPATSEDGIGYVLPARVKIEWLTLDKSAIVGAIKLDPVEVNKLYIQNRATYTGEFAAERTKIEQKLTDERVTKVMNEATRVVKSVVEKAMRDLDAEGTTRKLPTDWPARKPKLEDLAAAIVEGVQNATGLAIPKPGVEIRAAEWLKADQIKALPGIGGATVRLGTLRLPMDRAAFMVKELSPERDLGMQTGVTFTASSAADGAGNQYYFTVLDARATSPAESLDEVRAQARTDLKVLRAYAKQKDQIPHLRDVASASGLEAVAKLAAEPAATAPPPVQKGMSVSRERRGASDSETDDKGFVEAVFAAAAEMNPLALPSPETLPARTIAVPIQKKLEVVVAQVTSLQPLTLERMRTLKDRDLVFLASQEESPDDGPAPSNPFSFDTMKARWDLKIKTRESEEGEPSPAPKSDTKKPEPPKTDTKK